MTPAQRLVNRIREFVNGYDQEPTPAVQDMAHQYLEMCRNLNARLAKCDEFLEKGMRSEAVQEALEPPSVFEQVETLSFPELKTWRNLCMDLSMAVPPELHIEIVERLEEECSTEQFLEPLLRNFRRLVHEGTAEQRVRVLRRIKVLDPDNPVWQENIEPLEQQELEELSAQAESALQEDDIPALQDIHDRFIDPDRIVLPPSDLMMRVDDKLRQHHEDAAAQEGQKLCARLEEAQEQEDFQAAEPLLEKWRRLRRYEHFHPTAEMESIAQKCQSWYERQQREQRVEHEYREALQAVEAEMKRSRPDYRALEQSWLHLQGINRPVPEELRKTVTRTLSQMRREKARRRLFKTVVILALLAIVVAGLVIGGLQVQKRRTDAQVVKTVTQLWEDERYQDLRQYISQLRESHPEIFRSSAVQNYQRRATEIMETEQDRQERLAEIFDRLRTIRNSGFSASRPEINALLTEADTKVRTDEARQMLSEWRRSWAEWQRESQEKIDRQFVAQVKRLHDQAEALLKNVPQQDPEVSDRQLNALRDQLTPAEKLYPQASPAVRDQWKTLQALIQQVERDIAQRRQVIQQAEAQKQKVVTSLNTFARDLNLYEKTLQEFVEQYPNAAERQELQRVLHEMTAYRDASALAAVTFPALPQTREKAVQYAGAIDNLPATAGSVWYPDLSRCAAYGAHNETVRREMMRLRQLPFYNLKTVRVRERQADDAQWQVYYYPDRIYQRTETDAEGEFIRYWGDVYVGNPDVYQPRLERRSFISRQHELDLSDVEEENLVPAAKFARELLASARGRDYLDLVLTENLQKLQAAEDLATIPKAILAKTIVEWIVTIMPHGGSRLARTKAALQNLHIDKSWINAEHPRIQELQKQALQALENIPPAADVASDLRYNRWLLTAALSRQVKPVGVIERDAESKQLKPVFFAGSPRAAWIVLPAGATAPNQFALALRLNEENNYEAVGDYANKLFFGQLLFAPADGLSTADFLEKGPVNVPEGGPFWPHCWPINARQVK